MKPKFVLLLVAIVVFLCLATQANPDGITYTESGTVSGILAGPSSSTPFTDAPVTVTFVGDTSNVTTVSGTFQNVVATATITIGGVGTFDLTGIQVAIDVPVVSGVALEQNNPAGRFEISTTDSAFATYDLTTAIGPITGAANTAGLLFTSGGKIDIFSIGPDSTFTATTFATAPEPSSLLLLGAGMAALGIRRRKASC